MQRPQIAPNLIRVLLGVALTTAGCSGGNESSVGEIDPVALVHVEIARADTLAETLRAYGMVIPAPGAVQSISVPFEAIVDRVLVNEGQRVEQGQALVQVSPGPRVELAAEQAQAELILQETLTNDTRKRFKMGLATRDEKARQERDLASAKAQVDKYSRWVQQSGLLASASGLVREVLVSEGALVSPGSPLVLLALPQRFEVRLGVEPEDLPLLYIGQTLYLSPVDHRGYAPLAGRIRSIGQQVSPDTRLVVVLAAPPDGTDGLLLNQFVRVDIEVRGTGGLIVPRSALLPHEDVFRLFTVKNGRAVQHDVEVSVETDSLVQVSGGGLSAGDSVVVVGNYELADSTRVQVPDALVGGKRR